MRQSRQSRLELDRSLTWRSPVELLRLLDGAFFHAGFREDPHRRHHEYGGDDNEYRELRPDRRTAPERQYRGHNQRDGGDSSFDVSRHGNRPLASVGADRNRRRLVGTARGAAQVPLQQARIVAVEQVADEAAIEIRG